MEQIAFFVGPVGFYEQRQGVLTQAVLHVVVQVGLLHAGERTLEAFVVVWFSERARDVVRLLGLPLFVLLTGRSHLTLLLRHDGLRRENEEWRRFSALVVGVCSCICVVSESVWVVSFLASLILDLTKSNPSEFGLKSVCSCEEKEIKKHFSCNKVYVMSCMALYGIPMSSSYNIYVF